MSLDKLVIKACSDRNLTLDERKSLLDFCENINLASGNFVSENINLAFNLSEPIPELQMTPLMLAIDSGFFGLALEMVKNYKIDVNRKINDKDALSIIQEKVTNEPSLETASRPLIEFLTKGRQDSSICDLLYFLNLDDFSTALKVYLDHGGDINFVDDDGDTMLWSAIYTRKYEHAKLLIQKGADVTIAHDGHTIRSYIEQDKIYWKESLKDRQNKMRDTPDDHKMVNDCQDFLDFLSSREPFPIANGAVFNGSFQDGKPFRGVLTTKDGVKIQGFFKVYKLCPEHGVFKNGEFVISL